MQKKVYLYSAVFSVVIGMLNACSDKASEPESTFCLNQYRSCVSTTEPEAILQLKQTLEIEHPITITLQLPKAWKIQQLSAQLVGRNMQMGRIPIRLTPTQVNNEYSGTLFVVACTQPDMVWQLEVEVELEQLNQRHLLRWPFSINHME